MKIMAVNAGSSSLKFKLLEMPAEKVLAEGLFEEIGTNTEGGYKISWHNGEMKFTQRLRLDSHADAVDIMLADLIDKKIINNLNEIDGVGHRIVHGGVRFTESVVITDTVIREIADVIPLAPLHNPAHLIGIKAFRKALPNVFQIVVFDTAFHQTMAEDAFMYAVPYSWYQDYKVRKYGAHGTSHQYVAQRCSEIMGKDIKDLKIVTLHIGAGASLAAVKGGVCVDTSMGLGPLAGIPMGTRSGTIDPTVIEYVHKMAGLSLEEILNILNKKSGYLGVSGISSDARALEDAANHGNTRASLILNLQAKRVADYIGSYYVYMQGIDAIVFTAGIGENDGAFRKRVLDRLLVLGVKYIPNQADLRKCEAEISAPDSKIKVYIIPTDEELAIARDVVNLKAKYN